MNSKTFVIFTDGASRGNPGPGGWGAVVIDTENKTVKELGGREDDTTNNRMELSAAIRGIAATPQGSSITLYTDSSYVINGITKWIAGWKRNGWQTKAKEDVMNKIFWMELDSVLENRSVSWKYVGGHVGIEGNERCDAIATSCADKKDPELFEGPLSNYSISDILNISHDPAKAAKKSSGSSRSNVKAYSYVSAVKGKVEIHKTWAECEKRVKGVSGARFKKSANAADEIVISQEFGRTRS